MNSLHILTKGRLITCLGFESATISADDDSKTITFYGGEWGEANKGERIGRRTLDERDDKVIVEMTEAGATNQQIADRLGFSVRSIIDRRKAANLPASPAGVRFPAAKREQALGMLRGGASYGATARTLHCSATTLRNYFPGYGMKRGGSPESMVGARFSGGKRIPDEVIAQAAQMLDDGSTYSKVAERLGISRSALHRRLPGRRGADFRRIPESAISRAGELLKLGASYVEVGRIVGVSPETLRTYFPGQGLDQYRRKGKRCTNPDTHAGNPDGESAV